MGRRSCVKVIRTVMTKGEINVNNEPHQKIPILVALTVVIFIPQTARPGKHRLLIVDGHGSHETGKFQYLCMRNNISLVYLPSHASHILQPPDVGLPIK
jgi:hypothetical protein